MQRKNPYLCSRCNNKQVRIEDETLSSDGKKPMVANEPAVAYGMTSSRVTICSPTPYEMEILRRSEEDSEAGRVYTQEEVDKLLERWLN